MSDRYYLHNPPPSLPNRFPFRIQRPPLLDVAEQAVDRFFRQPIAVPESILPVSSPLVRFPIGFQRFYGCVLALTIGVK